MESEVRKIISEFDSNPITGARSLRALVQADRAVFLKSAMALLRKGEDSAGVMYLQTMLLSQGLLLRPLCDPSAFTLEEATKIARHLMVVDPRFDLRLLRTLIPNNSGISTQELERIAGTAAGIRLLEIIAEVSDGAHVLPTMTRLLSHPDTRVRSKAALLVGRSNKNYKWVQERLSEPDARVRANAVESLWGSDTAGSRAVFWSALGDDDSRVVGNAVLALYRLGDQASIRLILQMMSHPETAFRSTGVWVMGETGDSRFLPTLGRLISDAAAELRGEVFRSIAKLKKAMANRSSGAPLGMFMGQTLRAEDNWVEFTAAIRCARGQQIPELTATNFAIWEDSVLVREYSVRQRGRHEPAAVALGLPRLLDRTGPLIDLQEAAVERALRYKRKQDIWTVLKYVTTAQERAFSAETTAALTPSNEDLAAARMPFTTDPEHISDAVSTPGTRMACASDLHQAARALIAATGHTRAARNIILVCQSPVDTFTRDVHEEVEAANMASVAVHIISPWANSPMHELCSKSQGTLLTPSSPDEIPEALEALCASLVNSYKLRYQPEKPGASKLRLQVCTDMLMGEGVQNLL
jgi:HEAT repeat protein